MLKWNMNKSEIDLYASGDNNDKYEIIIHNENFTVWINDILIDQTKFLGEAIKICEEFEDNEKRRNLDSKMCE